MAKKVKGRWHRLLTNVFGMTALAASSLLFSDITTAANNADGIRLYQNAPTLTEEHKQTIAEDIHRFRSADNLWDVLRDEFSLPHYENNPVVQAKIEFFMNNQDFLLRSVNRAAPYLYYISQQVRKRHLPAELVLLPIVESGYNPFATSHVGAAGIWQLMPGTATGLGIQQDWWYDGRRDVIASTRAALNYLAYLQSFFDGNWLLAIAAYNTGEGNVLAAIRRNIQSGNDTDFWSLPIATETKNYVPSILALAIIISNPEKYPIYFPQIRNAPYLAQFDVQKKLNLKQAAALAGISYNKMIQLNPGYTRPTAKGGYKLILPIENVEKFSENLQYSPYREDTPPSWKHYRMKAGDTLLSVAKKFKTTAAEIRQLNHLGKINPRRGTNLLIPDNKISAPEFASNEEGETIHKGSNPAPARKKESNVATRLSEKLFQNYKLHPGDTIYMVRTNDTLEKIAQRFHVGLNSLITANKIQNKQVAPGRQLIIPTHPVEIQNTGGLEENINTAAKTDDQSYVVRKGDTIAKIARRFNTSPASIRLANMIDDSTLIEGISLIIPAPIQI